MQDAASSRAEAERRALATLASLPAGAVSASPARIRLAEVAARALARDGRWSELLAVTGGETPTAAPETSEILVRIRGLALRQVGGGEDLELPVWGDVLLNAPDRLKTLIKRLRRAIDPLGNWIVSERGVGYALRPPEAE